MNTQKKHWVLFKWCVFPAAVSLFYLFYSYFTFDLPVNFLIGHILILILLILMVSAITFAVRWFFILLQFPSPGRWAAMVPASAFFLLWFCYISSIFGNLSLGLTPNIHLLSEFLPEIFSLAGIFSISPPLVLAIIFLPPAGYLFFTLWQSGDLTRRASSNSRKGFPFWLGLIFMASGWILGFFSSAFVGELSNLFSIFPHDPIVQLFNENSRDTAVTHRQFLSVKADIDARSQVMRDAVFKKKPTHRNIFIFVVDALRADHLPLYGYDRPTTPFLTQFITAHRGKIVPVVLANGNETATALPAMFLSKNFPDIGSANYSLIDYLQDQGFKINVIMSGDHEDIITRGYFGLYSPQMTDGTSNRNKRIYQIGDDEALIHLANQLPEDDGDYHFIYFHLMSVHEAGNFHKAYDRFGPFRNIGHLPWQKNGPSEIPQIVNYYDDSILQADDILRQIIGILAGKGYMKDYAAVITSDHGQMLGEHGLFGHTNPRLYFPNLRIPLILFGSVPVAAVPNRFGLEVDIAPTITAMVGLRQPVCWIGKSLLKPNGDRWGFHFDHRQPLPELSVSYWHKGELWKYTDRVGAKGQVPIERLNDLNIDPQENENLIGISKPAFVEMFRKYLEKAIDPSGSSQETVDLEAENNTKP